jgi:hypothetical protein
MSKRSWVRISPYTVKLAIKLKRKIIKVEMGHIEKLRKYFFVSLLDEGIRTSNNTSSKI